MPASAPDYDEVAKVSKTLVAAGFEPVLIGGIAMVVHGSSRATRDADYALEKTENALRHAVQAMIDAGYGVIFGWDSEAYEPLPDGVQSDLTVLTWAAAQQPKSIWFWNADRRIRIDLVFDLPVPINELRARAARISINGQTILLASPADLRTMKQAALKKRPSRLTDELDILFLERTFDLGEKKRRKRS